MHRTEAPGNSSGAYVDKNLPGTAGTKLVAADRNAVQEEIANVVTRAGLALKTAATETGDQLEAVIFDADIVRTGDMSFELVDFSIETDLTTGLMRVKDSSTDEECRIWASKFAAVRSDSDPCESELKADGIKFPPISGSTQLTPGPIRTCVISTGALVWTQDADTTRIWHASPTLVIDGVEDTCEIVSASLRWTNPTFGAYSCPAFLRCDSSSGELRVVSFFVMGTQPDAADNTGHKLYVTYERK